MSRSKRAKTTVNVELFPFLAVLMCAMGALILVLLAVARHSHQQALAEAEAAVHAAQGPQQAEREAEQNNLLSRAALLEQDRDVSAAELARRRQEIAELEAAGKRLRQELAELEAELAGDGNRTDESDKELKEKLARLRRQIADATLKLHQARKAAEASAQSFAVIPYIGSNGTRRRPIYIECCADGVILQPEGIMLSDADFPENVLSLNPLSAGVQAAATYYERAAPPDAVEEPYPLLLVRPEGVAAYYAARAALKSWGADFGYEFVDADWTLRYDPPNPHLAEMQRLAIQDARGKQRMMALASSHRPRERVSGFRVSGTGGGLVRDDNGQPISGRSGRQGGPAYGGPDGETPTGRFTGGGRFGSGGSDQGDTSNGGLAGNSAAGAGNGMSGRYPGGSTAAGGTFAAGSNTGSGGSSGAGLNGAGDDALGGEGAGTGLSGGGDPLLASAGGGDRLLGGGAGTGSGFSEEKRAGSGGGDSPLDMGRGGAPGWAESGGEGAVVGTEEGGQGTSGGNSASGGSSPRRSAGNSKSGGNAAGTANGTTSSGGSSSGGSGNSGGSDAMGAAGGVGMPTMQFGKQPTAASSESDELADRQPVPQRFGEYHEKLTPEERRELAELAKKREKEKKKDKSKTSLSDTKGKNWALPDASQNSIPLSRPIRIECAEDHLRIVPERRGDQTGKRIEFGERTEDSVDELVSNIWDHMRAWGIAGQKMYWRPVLQIEIAPGGEQRCSELAALLDGSGMTIREKKMPAVRQRQPKQQRVLR